MAIARWFIASGVAAALDPATGSPVSATRQSEPPVPSTSAPESGSVSAVQERDKTATSGLGLSAGIGSQYTVVGAQAAYYLQVPRSLFRVAPYAGFGAVDGGATGSQWAAAAVFGLLGSWGRKHRVIVDAFCGEGATTSISLHGEPSDMHVEWGAGLAVGYEYMAHSGFFLRGDLGAFYLLTPPIFAPKERVLPALTLIGLGYKFW